MKKRLFTDKNISRLGNFVDRHILSVPLLKNGIPPFSSVEFSINGACNVCDVNGTLNGKVSFEYWKKYFSNNKIIAG